MKKILLSLITGLLFGQVSGQSIQDTAKIAFFKEVNAVYQLKPEEKARLLKDGFVALERHRYPSFRQAFEHIYYKDLPVFVSSDAILHSVHASFEEMMSDVEQGVIAPKVNFLLESARKQLKERQSEFTPVPQLKEAALELDFYLTVAEALHNNLFSLDSAQGYHWDTDGKKEVLATCQPLFAENKERINYVLSYIHAQVPQTWQQLGYEKRIMDFAQFTTRGRYATRYGLDQYFKTMMWFGFVGWQIMPALEADYKQPENYQKATIAVYLLSELTDKAQYDQIEQSLTWMTGDSDDLTLNEFRKTAQHSGILSVSDLIDLEKMKRFHQHLRKSFADKAKLPNHYGSIDFKLFGQRITLDAGLQGILTENGEKPLQTPELMYALGAKDALKISNLAPTAKTNQAVKANKPTASQKESVYGKWLSMIQSLNEKNDAYPPAMKTPAWQAKTLNTQLNSWTHLKHSHILNAKQAMGGSGCLFPYSFVEPNPAFWESFQEFARKGLEFAQKVAFNDPTTERKMMNHFTTVLQISDTLKGIAQKQLQGETLTKAEDYFLKCMVKKVEPDNPDRYLIPHRVAFYHGWYPRMFYSIKSYSREYEYSEWVFADVQRLVVPRLNVYKTQYSGTGKLDLGLIITQNADGKPCLFAGPIASYFEGEISGKTIFGKETWRNHLHDNVSSLFDEEDSLRVVRLRSAMKRPQWINQYVIRDANLSGGNYKRSPDGNWNDDCIDSMTVNNFKKLHDDNLTILPIEYTADSLIKVDMIGSIYPNPFKEECKILFDFEEAKVRFPLPIDPNKKNEARPYMGRRYSDDVQEKVAPFSAMVYDILGRKVATLEENKPLKKEEVDDRDYHLSLTWDGKDASGMPLPSGTYVVKVVWGKYTQSARVALVRE